MKCPYRKIVTKNVDTVKVDFAECYEEDCPYFKSWDFCGEHAKFCSKAVYDTNIDVKAVK